MPFIGPVCTGISLGDSSEYLCTLEELETAATNWNATGATPTIAVYTGTKKSITAPLEWIVENDLHWNDTEKLSLLPTVLGIQYNIMEVKYLSEISMAYVFKPCFLLCMLIYWIKSVSS